MQKYMGNSSASQMGAHAHTIREKKKKKKITTPLRTAVIPQSTQNYSFQAFSQVRHFQECHMKPRRTDLA